MASIPSPAQGVWHLGPLPIRGYALCILLGIVVALWITRRRWVARGGRAEQVADVAFWAIPAGVIGARIYHVLTDWPTYFGPDGLGFVAALKIWQGGLGIWGAVAGGALGAWIACRRYGILLPPFADALAPALPAAQAIGRWGNWFNQELFGKPSDLPWAVEIDPAHRPPGYEQFATFTPTFLYESLWCVLVAVIVWWADRRFRMGHGRAFALYVALYCAGRLPLELVRIDPATQVGGLRINVITSVVVGLGAVLYIVVSARLRPGPDVQVMRTPAPVPADAGDHAEDDIQDAAEDDIQDAAGAAEVTGQRDGSSPRPEATS